MKRIAKSDVAKNTMNVTHKNKRIETNVKVLETHPIMS